MPKWLTSVIGGVELAAGIASEVVGAALIGTGVGAPLGAFLMMGPSLIAAGIGTSIAGVGQLMSQGPLQGTSTTHIGPIDPWEIPYGRVATGGTLIYDNEWGDSDKYRDMVILAADCQTQGVSALMFDRQRIQIDTTSHAPGVPASTWPFINGGTSFTPVQQTVNLGSISRTKNVVTVALGANIPLLLAGDYIIVENVTGDKTLNGKFQVAQILYQTPGSPGNIGFTYLNGGAQVTYTGQGDIKTCWPDYGRKVYMEVLTGTQTLGQTFVGMTVGEPADGDVTNINTIGPTNPWTADCSCVGKTIVFLRLHYNDTYFANGLPQISFLLSGKNNIVDPRTTPPTVGYSENAALCAADFLCDQTYGYKMVLGYDPPSLPGRTVNIPALIAAANICDQPVALAVPVASPAITEPRYTCNGKFNLTQKRGDILQNMLSAMGGRITYDNGSVKLWPAAWAGGPPGADSLPTSSGWFGSLVGAWTDSGGNVIEVQRLGDGPSVVIVPVGATQLQLGFDDTEWFDNFGSWVIAVNGTNYTVLATAQPWVFVSGGINTTYQCGTFSDGTAPTVITGFTAGQSVTVSYVSGLASGGGPYGAIYDANGVVGVSGTAGVPPNVAPAYYGTTGVGYGVLAVAALSNAAGAFRWHITGTTRDLFNGVKGTYINQANNWQSSDFPPYAQDALHGYTAYSSPLIDEGDANLVYDGGDRRWKDIQLPFTISAPTAQRLGKIELLRTRKSGGNPTGTGTFVFNLTLYPTTALDVIAMTLPLMSWVSKYLEVTAARFRCESTTLYVELDVQETDPSVYVWNSSEELSPQGYQESVVPGSSGSSTGAPTNVFGIPGPSVSLNEAGGVGQSIILVTWTAPADGYVTNGGHIEAQYQLIASPEGPWIALPSVPPSVTQITITGVADGSSYTVQLRAVNAGGTPSAWVDAMSNASPPTNVITVTNALTQLWLINGS